VVPSRLSFPAGRGHALGMVLAPRIGGRLAGPVADYTPSKVSPAPRAQVAHAFRARVVRIFRDRSTADPFI